MPWWGWMVIGLLLLGAELFVVEADFFLVFIGASAMVTGLVAVSAGGLPEWAQWLVFAALAVVSMVFFRKRVYAILRGGATAAGMQDNLVGQVLVVGQRLGPGESCRIEHQGAGWTVRNEGTAAIDAGSRVRVLGVDGVVLRVEQHQ